MRLDLQADDETLLARVSEGNREAFSILYSRYIHNLYRYVYLVCKSHEDSEEIVQDLFVKLWENRAHGRVVSSFKSYIYRSAKNQIIDYVRKQKSQLQLIDKAAWPFSNSEFADSPVILKQYAAIVKAAIEKLPQKRKLIFEMRTQDDLSLDEIASKLGISKNVVKKQFYQGASFVRTYVTEQITVIIFLIIVFATKEH
jgi:RNA polymerase sigma-70 factor (ECF subfamily)